MARHKDVNWNLTEDMHRGRWEELLAAILMDIRDELKALNGVIGCYNFRRVPTILDEIRENTKRPKRKRK